MHKGETVSVIFPTYREKDSIRGAIEDFFASGLVDEIVVVDNNAIEGTETEVAATRARRVVEPRQGYGHALQRGMAEATGDILILAEPDGTFCGRDVSKMLAYSEDLDVVFGTRTSRFFILQGANMGIFLKWGNYAVGKMVELLFNTTLLTDVGCTLKLLRRRVYETVRPGFRVGGSHFGLHLMLLVICRGIPFVEIPVNYGKRVGKSAVTGSLPRAFLLGWVMIGTVLWARVASLLFPRSVYHGRG